MRDKLGIMLVEEANGQIGVQLFADPDKVRESFDNMVGKLGQSPQRVTFLALKYEQKENGLVLSLGDFRAKDLPMPEVPISERPDAWRLGEGPVKIGD